MQRDIRAVIGGGADEWAMRLAVEGGNYQRLRVTTVFMIAGHGPEIPCIAGDRENGVTDCILLDGSGIQVTFAPREDYK